ncbi:MAG: Nif3-like dinuclear metal center hexameric protein [Clostridia bacterium]|nr:Nif3-like dinuclear metal center hexameric protein [Clostridia bacterium]
MTTVKNIYDYINSVAPYDSQEEWDNSGHLVGDFRKPVKKVVMALDCTKDVVAFAKDVNADLIFTHHPLIFGGIKNVLSDTAVYNLVNSDIAFLCAHTNLDKSECGINANLAKIMGLNDTYAICDGFVIVGSLDTPMSMDDFAEYIEQKLGTAGIRYTDTDKLIKTVAVGGGACSEFMWEALEKADCFVTGDLKYHEMLDASEKGCAVVSAGHFETENAAFLMFKDNLKQIFTDVEFVVAPRENPIKTI